MIRRAKQEDLKRLLSLLFQLSPSKARKITLRQREILKTILAGSNQEILVYEDNGGLIGTATVLKRANLTHQGRPAGYVENVVVDKSCRGQGIGQQLVKKCIEIAAKDWNCYKIILTSKPKLARFYGKSGFKEFKEMAMRVDIN